MSERGSQVDTAANRRAFIQPGSVTELRVLTELVQRREVGPWPPADDDTEWRRLLYLLERSIGMHMIGDAFTELVDDETTLFDPDQRCYPACAVPLSLDRDEFGQLTIGVFLKEVAGGQLSFVLEVARRHELEVREEGGWLRLSPQLIATEDDADREPAEAVA